MLGIVFGVFDALFQRLSFCLSDFFAEFVPACFVELDVGSSGVVDALLVEEVLLFDEALVLWR